MSESTALVDGHPWSGPFPGISVGALLRRVRGTAGGVLDPGPGEPPPRWRGRGALVLVGGLCTTELTLAPLREWLGRLGYTVTTYTAGAGMGCGAQTVERLREVVRRADDGDGVRLVGYSRGGQFARVALQDPDLPVRSLTTLGTPFDLYGVSRPLLLQAAAIAVAGTLGVPGLARLSCVLGECCAEFREMLRAPVRVPFTALYSREDRLVRWQACLDPGARLVEVPGSHLDLVSAGAPLRAVARELSEPVPALAS